MGYGLQSPLNVTSAVQIVLNTEEAILQIISNGTPGHNISNFPCVSRIQAFRLCSPCNGHLCRPSWRATRMKTLQTLAHGQSSSNHWFYTCISSSISRNARHDKPASWKPNILPCLSSLIDDIAPFHVDKVYLNYLPHFYLVLEALHWLGKAWQWPP